MYEIYETKERIPHCECGGVIKPDVVLYEEGLDDATVRGALRVLCPVSAGGVNF